MFSVVGHMSIIKSIETQVLLVKHEIVASYSYWESNNIHNK